MRTLKTLALAVTAILYATAPAHADVTTLITFDELNAGASHILIGDATAGFYQGLYFTNFFAEKGAGDHVGIDGYANGVVSPLNAAYIDGASGPGVLLAPGLIDPINLIGFGNSFRLNSAYLTSTASNTNGAATHSTVSYVDVSGIDASFNGDCGGPSQPACFFAHVAVNDNTPTLVNFGWNVIGVIFTPVGPTPTIASPSPVPFDLVIDNLSVSGTLAAVPEPGAVFLFGVVGLALLPVIRRRFHVV